MSKVVEISPTTRHEGHSKLFLKVNDAIDAKQRISFRPEDFRV